VHKRTSTEHQAGPVPVTFRLPKAGTVDPYFGASRTFWNERILRTDENGLKPPVKSIVVKQRGAAKRGIRFIVFASAKNYFDALVQSQDTVLAEEVGA
jgi:hypothetical protein